MTAAQQGHHVLTEAELAAGELTTRDGVQVHVVKAVEADRAELHDFFRHVSPDDLRFRFLETIDDVSEAQVGDMISKAGVTTFLARRGEGGQVLAVATLAEQTGAPKAEVALTTRTEWKHHGVSWTLLEYVIAYAKTHGLKEISSLESAENRAAVKLEREMGFVARLDSADPVELLVSKKLSDDNGGTARS